MAFEVPNLTLLRQFVATAEEGGITRAARRLRISQPALSKNIRRLEEMLGTRLFERHAGGADLTAAGRLFLARAQVIGLEYQHALEDIRNALADQEATIRIGAGPIWASTILPIVAARFHAQFPRLRLHVRTGSIDELAEELRLGRLDIYAGAVLARNRLPGFVSRTMARAEIALIAARTHPLAGQKGPVGAQAIAPWPFVAFTHSQEVELRLSDWLRAEGAPPRRTLIETSSIFACMELVRTGGYLLYDTTMLVDCPIGQGLTVIEGGPRFGFDMGTVSREGLDQVSHCRSLLKIMADVLDRQVGGNLATTGASLP
jgi:DNA-binding transcriptional LysR family regulator